ncbi:MAG: regulator [Pseudomonadota bacterium]
MTSAEPFDPATLTWHRLGDFEHFVFAMLSVDRERRLVDAILKFDGPEAIFLHRHLAHTNTFVVQGEHVIHEPDGQVRERRAVGSFTRSPADPAPHRESGGENGAVVLYHLRGTQDTMFEILNDALQVVGTLGVQDFHAALEAQGGAT